MEVGAVIFVLALWAICDILSKMSPTPDQGIKNFIYLLCIVLIVVFVFIVGYHSRALFSP
jgi:hypothetical protein